MYLMFHKVKQRNIEFMPTIIQHIKESVQMKALIAITAIVISLAIPMATLGGEYTDHVEAQLALIKLAVLADGWTETHNDKFDKLDNGDSDSFSFTLEKGKSYKVISVCDNDCSDIDMVLYDENDNEISKDTKEDSMPIVEATPKWTGDFRLDVKMHSCRTSPCYYGISVLGK